MVISMLKIRRPLGRLIFNMGIAIPGKTVFLIETAPRTSVVSVLSTHTPLRSQLFTKYTHDYVCSVLSVTFIIVLNGLFSRIYTHIRQGYFTGTEVIASNRPPFKMEYRHLSKMRGTKKLLWNWNISIFQLLMDCLIYNDMKSCNKQWNTLPQWWNLLISIFHSAMEFHGIPWNSPEVPWNSVEFHGTFPGQKGSSTEFHGTLKVPTNLMPSPNYMEFHGTARPRTKLPWNSMEF